MAKNVRILFHGFILLLGAFSGCFCMVFMEFLPFMDIITGEKRGYIEIICNFAYC